MSMYEIREEEKTKAGIRAKLSKVTKGIYDIVEIFVIAAAFVIFSYFFLVSPHVVIGSSMEENFYENEYLLADKISYKFKEPRRGDVVVFKQTETADYIKRIIGLPGDTVELRDGNFYVNGEKLDESMYLDPQTYTKDDNYLDEGDKITVPEDHYFVVGDHREVSKDSRAFGPIDEKKIRGRAFLVYWPISHFKIVDRPEYN